MRAKLCGQSCLVVWLAIISLGAADGTSRLATAAKNRDWHAVTALLAQRADVNGVLPDGTTALHWAVIADAAGTVDELVRAGANVNAASRYKVTPLALACLNGSAPIVAKLLAAGADPNGSPNGEPPLMVAARTGDVATITLLLAHGAVVDARETELGQTALMWAVAEGHSDAASVLIQSGADPNVRSKRRQTAGNPGGYVRADLGEGASPLLFAVRKGDRHSVRALLSAGVDPNEKTPNGSPLPFVAIMNGHYDLVVLLVDYGADLHATNPAGRTVLHELIGARSNLNSQFNYAPPPPQTGSLDTTGLLRTLLAYGADPNARSIQKGPSRDNFAGRGDPLDGRLNLEGATPFLLAARNADVAAMRILVEAGADPRLPTMQNSTPLMAAAGVAGRRRREEGPTPEEVLDAVRLTVALGNDVNAANINGQTALHGGVYVGLDNVIQFLVERGANLDAKDARGRTPLVLAERFRDCCAESGFDAGDRDSTIALLSTLAADRHP